MRKAAQSTFVQKGWEENIDEIDTSWNSSEYWLEPETNPPFPILIKLSLFKYTPEFVTDLDKNEDDKRKLWSSGRVLGSWLEDRGIDPHPMLDGSGVKAMPGLIPAPNPGSFNNWKEKKYR